MGLSPTLAWRNMMTSIIGASLEAINKTCLEDELDPQNCARTLLASADAVYSPLKPIDSGLGEARRVASMLAAIIANTFLIRFLEERGEEPLREVLEALKSLKDTELRDEVKRILDNAQVAIEPASAREPRESLYKDIEEYLNPPQPPIPRRRRQPRKPDPRQRLRRLMRDLGRRDPILAKAVAKTLRTKGISI